MKNSILIFVMFARTCTYLQAQHPEHADIANWNAISIEAPNNWTTINIVAVQTGANSGGKTQDTYSGSHAIRIENVEASMGDSVDFITNGYFGKNGPVGGMAVSANPMKITGYYKYMPTDLDSALAGALTYLNSALIESNMVMLEAQNSYTYFEIPLSYTGLPMVDTLNIIFAASNPEGSDAGLGSVLFIDELSVSYHPVGIAQSPYDDISYTLYPNPLDAYAFLYLNIPNGESYDFTLYDMSGQRVFGEEKIVNNVYLIHKNNLSAGMYRYCIYLRERKKFAQPGTLIIK